MAAPEKKLTDPPENLKEAVDWVIKVEEVDGVKGLAGTLQAMLNGDPGDVREEVINKFGEMSKSVIQKLHTNTSENRSLIFGSFFDKLSKGSDPFDFRIPAHISREKAKSVGAWASSVKDNDLKTLIEGLASGLKTFIGWGQNGKPDGNSGIGSSNYVSSYKSVTDKWNSLTSSQRKNCALTLLGIMPVLYFGLSYLYWLCTDEGNNDPRWSKHTINGDGNNQDALKNFLEKVGFSETSTFDQTKKGSDIVKHLAGFNDLTTAKAASNSYATFLSELQKQVLDSMPPNASRPLTSLYHISYNYITYPFYTVQSTNPATPSFHGYSGVAALAGGAYGLNLGGVGTFVSALLA
ncbi:variant erythrocyte surface antigen-1 family protein [Babesia caballi]|uniref:Variant erythrocyte surface antigen-1 family protein n=1 Tax=Babesia caballi TaxID=5871 RepID=A0AAV4LYG9_BABCB|nr:variant erythrocyte surface antigen-1 family protein [Babesia caballi]